MRRKRCYICEELKTPEELKAPEGMSHLNGFCDPCRKIAAYVKRAISFDHYERRQRYGDPYV